jgi:hypothetical protein
MALCMTMQGKWRDTEPPGQNTHGDFVGQPDFETVPLRMHTD